MALPKQTKINRENAKRSTGPKSTAGKLTVSKNAITHGINVRGFINNDEENTYQTFLTELQKAYPSSNPLVKIQIDRIAKTKIQLDRVQKAIDAAFAYAETPSISDEAIMDLLRMTDLERLEAKDVRDGKITIDGIVNVKRIRVAAELAHINTSEFTSHDEFLYHTPILCRYLIQEASSLQQNIDYYITRYASSFVNTDETQERFIKTIARIAKTSEASKEDEPTYDDYGLPISPTDEEIINKVKLENLKIAAEFMRKQIDKLAGMHYKVILFNQLRKAKISPLTLNYSHLDSLQRYQTPLNNQLSRMMGELLELVKQ